MARIINTTQLVPIIKNLVMKACYEIDINMINSYDNALKLEKSPYSKMGLELIIKNANFAKENQIACCQDTGACVIFFEIGQQVSWDGPSFISQVNEGVRQGYNDGYLRKSMVVDPIGRKNTNDNTPAIIHTEIIPGDKVQITVMPKGGGSENMSKYAMLMPSDGIDGIKKYVIDTVNKAGGKPCPPIVVGIGIGGTMDKCTHIAKKALLRPIGEHNLNPIYEQLEIDLLQEINKLGIGTMGMGGTVTAFAVNVEYYPCHITSLPIAVNIQCHSNRHAEFTL